MPVLAGEAAARFLCAGDRLDDLPDPDLSQAAAFSPDARNQSGSGGERLHKRSSYRGMGGALVPLQMSRQRFSMKKFREIILLAILSLVLSVHGYAQVSKVVLDGDGIT